MKIVKILVGALLALVVLFFGVGMFLPEEYAVERSTTMDAAAAVVFAQVNVHRNGANWSPWRAKDPNMEISYSGPDSGEGATMSWVSETQGMGTMVHTKVIDNQRIESHLDFGDMGEADSYWLFDATGDNSTKVTWGFTGKAENIVGRYFGLKMDDWVGADYEDGLARLKSHVESLPPPAPATDAVTDAVDAIDPDAVPESGPDAETSE